MATYTYRCEHGLEVEEQRSIHDGPYPTPIVTHEYYTEPIADPKYFRVDECPTRLVFHTSLIVYGDFEMGDDDFSRRYWNNGANEAAKPNGTQNKTNVNAILRKYGRNGMPMELRKDIDPNYITEKPLPKWSNGEPGGHVAAPDLMRRSAGIPTSALG